MRFDCPYCGKHYEVEGENINADLLFTCSNCGKFVGLFHRIELSAKLSSLVNVLSIIKYVLMFLCLVITLFFCVSRSRSPLTGEISVIDIIAHCVCGAVALLLLHVLFSIVIYRFEALSFQTQKTFEAVELEKYLIGQIKKS